MRVIMLRVGNQTVLLPEPVLERLRDGINEILNDKADSVRIGEVEARVWAFQDERVGITLREVE